MVGILRFGWEWKESFQKEFISTVLITGHPEDGANGVVGEEAISQKCEE